MPTQTQSTDMARAFTEAWTRRAWDAAGSFVGDEVVFDGPLGHVEGKQEYLDGLKRLSAALGITGVNIRAAYGDAGDTGQVLIMYDLLTSNFGPLTCAKLLMLRDGQIVRDLLTFDSYPVRQKQPKS